MLNPGELDQSIEIQELTIGQDEYGAPVETSGPAAGAPKWAKLRPLRGQEKLLAQQVRSEEQTRFVIRRWASLDAAVHKILHGGKVWDITSVEDHGAREAIMVVWAKT